MTPHITLPKPIVSCYQTSNGLSDFCSIVLETLYNAEPFQQDRTTCRVVTIDNWPDTRICCIMLQHLGLAVDNFGGYEGRPHGLVHINKLYGQLSDLTQEIQNLYNSIISDWILTNEPGPNFINKGVISQYHVFKKDNFIRNEDILIRFLSSRLGVIDALKCHSDGNHDPKRIYIFIKKSALNKVVAKIHFNIPLIPDIPEPETASMCTLI